MEDQEKDEQGADFEDNNSWLKDNLRIIVSIIIVVAIAGGVYSYSKRNQSPSEETIELAEEEMQEEEGMVELPKSEESEAAKPAPKQEIASAATSQETAESFVETAGRGDGKTHLARRALANYLEKNPDSTLTPEHKIYIEDYLRKNSGPKGRVFVGTSAEFSKDLINKAIESSKNLNDKQLDNLHKYAVQVPSLT